MDLSPHYVKNYENLIIKTEKYILVDIQPLIIMANKH